MCGFVPSPTFAQMKDRRHRLICARAANRVGKSRHASWVAATEAIDLPAVLGRPAHIRIVGPNRRQTHDVIGRYLAEFLRGHLADGSYYVEGKGWNRSAILLSNGSTIQLRSMEDDPQTHAGSEHDLIVIDEVPKRAHFGENMARIGSIGGRMIVVMTPVDRPIGWFREIVEAEGSPWKQIVAVFSAENCPWYSAKIIADHLETMRASGWQWAQRVEGAWEGVSDERELTGFTDESVTTEHPRGNVDLMLTFDHGTLAGKTVALLWAIAGPTSWVMDEYIPDEALTPDETARGVDRMLSVHGFRLSEVGPSIGDVNVNGQGVAINRELEKAFARIARVSAPPFRIRAPYKGRGSVSYGVRLANYAFRRSEIKIHARCAKTIDACKHWQGRKTGEDGLLSDRIDALRYGAVKIHGSRKIYAQLRFT